MSLYDYKNSDKVFSYNVIDE